MRLGPHCNRKGKEEEEQEEEGGGGGDEEYLGDENAKTNVGLMN